MREIGINHASIKLFYRRYGALAVPKTSRTASTVKVCLQLVRRGRRTNFDYYLCAPLLSMLS